MTWALFKAALEECGIEPTDEILEIDFSSDTSYDGDVVLTLDKETYANGVVIRSIFMG